MVLKKFYGSKKEGQESRKAKASEAKGQKVTTINVLLFFSKTLLWRTRVFCFMKNERAACASL